MSRGQQFTTFVSRLKACAEHHNIEEATKIIQEGKLIMRLPQMLPRDQMSLLQSFDKLGINNQFFWEAVASNFNQHMDRKLPFEIANMGSVLGRNVKAAAIDWKGIEARILKGDRSTLAYDPYLVNIHTFFATFNKGSEAFWLATESLCVECLTNSLKSETSPTTLNNLLSKLVWAYSSQKKGSPQFWEEVDKLCRSLMNQHNGKSYSKMLLAVSKVRQLPLELKKELAKQATFHITDQGLTLADLHDLVLGLDNIDPLFNPSITEEVAAVLIKRIKVQEVVSKNFLNTVHRIIFELIEVRGLKEDTRIEAEGALATCLNFLGNPAILAEVEERALMYFATLPTLMKDVLEAILKLVHDKKFSLDQQIREEPGDYQLIADFLRVSSNSQQIDSSVSNKEGTKQAFIINKLSVSLAKFELSKSLRYPPSFNEELAASCKDVMVEYQSAMTETVLPPPESTSDTSKYFVSYLDETTSVRHFLRHLARMYIVFDPAQVSDANCQLITALYLRHYEDLGKTVENFVLKNQHLLSASPFLVCSIVALGSKVSKKDKAGLLRQLSSNIDQIDPLVLANSLVFLRALTMGNKVAAGTFAQDKDEAKSKVKDLLAEAQKYVTGDSWSQKCEELFRFKVVAEKKEETVTLSSQAEETYSQEKASEIGSSALQTSAGMKAGNQTVDIDLLGAYLETKYLKDPDFPPRTSKQIIKTESVEQNSGLKPMEKRVKGKRKLTSDSKDLIFTESNKKSELTDFEKIKISK